MADDEVSVKVSADDTGLKSGFDSAGARTQRFADEQERQSKKASAAWLKASKLVGKALVGFGAAGVAAFAGAGAQAASFESPMRRVNTIAKLGEEQFKALKVEVQAMSDRMKTTQSVDKMAVALYDIYSAGLEGEKALKTLEAATIAADAGSADLATTTDVLTTAMIAYKLPAEKAGYVSDILFKTVDKGKVSFQELASSIGPVLTVASKFGVSIEEVGAAYAQLSLTAASPAEAATALERAITQMAAPTPEVVKKLDNLGVAYGKNALASKGFLGVLREWVAASGGSDAELRKLLSSSEALKVGLELASDGGETYKDMLTSMGEAAGSARAANTEMTKDFKFSWDVLAKEVKNAAVKIGEVFLPLGTEILQFGAKMVNGFNTSSESTRQWTVGLGVGATAVAGVTGALFLLAPQIAALPRAFTLARTAAVAIAGVLTSEVVVAITGVVGAMALLVTAWDKDWLHMRTTAIQGAEAIREALIGIKAPGFDIGNDTPDPAAGKRSGLLQGRGQVGGINLASPYGGLKAPAGVPKVTILPASVGYGGQAASRYASSAFGASKNPQVQRMLDNLNGQQDQLDAIYAKARAEAAGGTKKTKQRAKSEDELRLAMVAQAKALVSTGTTTAEVRRAMGGLGTDSTQCANTMRLISERAKLVFPTDLQPFDKSLLGAGEGVGPATADSLFGSKVGSFFRDPRKAKAGDLAFYDTANRPGVVQHVEMVDAEGGTIGASSGQRRVVQRKGLGDIGDRRLIGFVSPSIYKGKGAGAQAGLAGDESEYLEEIKKRRQEFIAFMETDAEQQARELYENYQKALKGVRNPEERQKLGDLYAKKRNDLEVENNTGEGQLIGFGREMGSPDAVKAMLEEMVEAQRQAYARRKELGTEDVIARQQEIAQVLKSDQLAEETRHQLMVEKRQLEMDWQQQQTDNADARVERALQDLEFERETGAISLAEKLARLQQETVAFTGSLDKRRALLMELHQTEMQLEQEKNAMADQVFQNIEQGLQGMLQQALSSQQSFSQTFSSLWKSLANQIIAELAKMLIKALALQAVLRGIFGFFGGIFGGVSSAAASIPTGGLDLVGLPIAHSGGMVVPGGIQSFHTGGGVGINLRPDEVLAKLQVGEMVLSQEHVAALQSAPSGDPSQITQSFHYHAAAGNPNSGTDFYRFSQQLGRDMKLRAKEH